MLRVLVLAGVLGALLVVGFPKRVLALPDLKKCAYCSCKEVTSKWQPNDGLTNRRYEKADQTRFKQAFLNIDVATGTCSGLGNLDKQGFTLNIFTCTGDQTCLHEFDKAYGLEYTNESTGTQIPNQTVDAVKCKT
jgi:hypothetical protein